MVDLILHTDEHGVTQLVFGEADAQAMRDVALLKPGQMNGSPLTGGNLQAYVDAPFSPGPNARLIDALSADGVQNVQVIPIKRGEVEIKGQYANR